MSVTFSLDVHIILYFLLFGILPRERIMDRVCTEIPEWDTDWVRNGSHSMY